MDKKIHPFPGVKGLKIHTHNADFVTGLAALQKDIPAPFCKSHPHRETDDTPRATLRIWNGGPRISDEFT
jgi:hypothetical protein